MPELHRNRDLPPVPPLIPSPTSPLDNFPRTPLQTLSLAASFFAKTDALFDAASQPKKASAEERLRTRDGLYDEPFSAGSLLNNGASPPDAKKPKLEGSFAPLSKMPPNGAPPPMRPSPAEHHVPFPASLSPKSCADSELDYVEERVSPSPPASPYGSGSPSQRGCDSPVARRRNSSSSTDSGTEEAKDGESMYLLWLIFVQHRQSLHSRHLTCWKLGRGDTDRYSGLHELLTLFRVQCKTRIYLISLHYLLDCWIHFHSFVVCR